MLVLSTSIFAQSRLSFIRENFDSDDIPSGWTIMENGQDNWSIWPTNQAGGISGGEIKLNWRPAFIGTTRLVTPAINTTGLNEIIVSFKGFLDYYGQNDNHTLGIATTSDNGTTWNTVWEDTYNYYTQGQHTFLHTVSSSDIGKDNVQFCIFYNGDSNNLNAWYFDDIEIYSLNELNLSMISTTFPNIVGIESNSVTFKVQNTGTSTIDSFEASYQINDETPITETFDADLASTEVADFTFEETLTLIPGSYTLTLSILTVNGDEDLTIDNIITKDVDVAMGNVERTPLIEHFSSSTCGPCVYANQSMAILTENNPGKYSYVKYPMNWPLSGDPYCTAEGLIRKAFYNVVYAPQLFLDGVDNGGEPISSQMFDTEYNRPAYVDIKGAFDIQDSIVNVSVDVMGLVNIPSARLYATVNEKTTTGNVGTNGETEFHHIMMKMLNNAEGMEVEVKVGEYEHYEFPIDLSGTFVEDMSDLEVTVWLQDYYIHEVYNSHFMYESEHPYPAQNIELTKNDETSYLVSWETPEQGSPIGYNIYVNSILKAENLTELSYNVTNAYGLNVVNIVAIYEDGKKSVAISDMISMGEGGEITPCLAPTNVKAEVEQNADGYEHSFKVTLSWDAVDNAKEYVVYIDDEIPVNTTETSYIVGYDEEGNHEFKVVTICEDGISEASETIAFELIGVSIEEHETSLSIYPNPVKDNLTISTDRNIKEINIYNVIGINVYNEKVSVDSCPLTIDISSYNAGIYFIKVNTDNGEFIKQFIKE